MAKQLTNFPTQGDNKAISPRNSQYPQFDYEFAQRLKTQFPGVWDRGGNIRGNEAFNLWTKARRGEMTDGVMDWIREREAWAARHYEDFRLPGVVAQIKWGVIGSRGESYMKRLVRDSAAWRRDSDSNQED